MKTGHHELCFGQTRRTPDEVQQRDVPDVQLALDMFTHADIRDATLDVFQQAGNALAGTDEHGHPVLMTGQGHTWQHQDRQATGHDSMAGSRDDVCPIRHSRQSATRGGAV